PLIEAAAPATHPTGYNGPEFHQPECALNALTSTLPPLSNRFVTELPGDPVTENRVRQVSGSCWSAVTPRRFPQASLLAWSRELGAQLGFSPDTLGAEAFTAYLSGNQLLPGLQPYAQCYGGH